jgi:hypothetical protein
MASYLDPGLTDVKVTEAVRYHFPIGIQRVTFNMQLHYTEASDLLKSRNQGSEHDCHTWSQHTSPKTSTTQQIGDRGRDPDQIQYHQSHSRNSYWGQKWNFHSRDLENEPRIGGSQNLAPPPPRAVSFNSLHENRRAAPRLGETPARIRKSTI